MPSKFKRKPPSMDGLMNNVKSITKKIEHIKGFKFEIAPALSNNFHLSSSWVIPP
jgi:mitochondrial import receptor subunit TOM40